MFSMLKVVSMLCILVHVFDVEDGQYVVYFSDMFSMLKMVSMLCILVTCFRC